jgi:arylsulfatase A-like enzyme
VSATARTVAVALAAMATLAACRSERPGVVRLVARRWQKPGDPATVDVPSALVGEQLRPALSAHPWNVSIQKLPRDRPVTLTVDVPVPPWMRGVPVRLVSNLGSSATIVAQDPEVGETTGDHVSVRYTFSAPAPGTDETLFVTGRQVPEERWVSGPLTIWPGTHLHFGIGLYETLWADTLPAGLFTVTAIDGSKEHEVFRGRVDAGANPDDRRWLDQDVDLEAFAGRSIRLRFDAASETPGPPYIDPVWGDPTLYVREPLHTHRNVVLISIDTLRGDHLGCYGYPRPTSPQVDSQLAARGTLFERAYVTYPGTDGSHMSLLTGLYPCVHGLRASPASLHRSRTEAVTLAEYLRAAGWETAAFTEDAYVTAATGFARGFAVFSEFKSAFEDGGPPGHAFQTFTRGRSWLARNEKRLPFFLFLHTYQVHQPYTPPEGYAEKVAPEHGTDRASVDAALYDGEIRYTDELVGQFLAGLEAAGIGNDTLVVFTGDHGDQFGEHNDLFGHGNSLFDDLLHVPLVMRAPDLVPAGKRVADVAGLIDVVPTVLDLLGLPPPIHTQGVSLVPTLHDRPLAPRTLWAQLDTLGLIAARTPTVKWITGRRSATAYDLALDPHERQDISKQFPEDTWKKLRDEYDEVCNLLGPPPAPTPEDAIDPEVQKKLKALGYAE